MSNDLYLTPEDFAIAEKNGIHRVLAHNRFYRQWGNKKRAITQPVRKRFAPWAEWKHMAKANGICHQTFMTRIECGYTPEQAATAKPQTKQELAKKMRAVKPDRRISDEIIELARSNGIGYHTLFYRLFKSKKKWTEEEAATTPPMTPQEVSKRANEFSPFKNTTKMFFTSKKK